MAWTYSGNPDDSPLDRVRFLIGDTEPNDPLLSDEEISFLVSLKGSSDSAALAACEAILLKLSKEVDYSIGPEKVSASQRFVQYQAVARGLLKAITANNAAPSWRDPLAHEPRPIFDIGMHDARGSNGRGTLG